MNERSNDSDAELKILRRKLELAENKNKKVSSLEFENDELRREL